MAGFDVVIVGFRLNVTERPAAILERVLGMPGEEAKQRTRVFPHVIAEGVPKHAADTTAKLMQEAGARTEVRAHVPKSALAPMHDKDLTALDLGRKSVVFGPEGRKSLVFAAPAAFVSAPLASAEPQTVQAAPDARLAAKVSIYRLGDLDIPVQIPQRPDRPQAPRVAVAPAPSPQNDNGQAPQRTPLDVEAAAKALGVQILPGTLEKEPVIPEGGRVLSDSLEPGPRLTIEHSALKAARAVRGARPRQRPSLIQRYRSLEAREGWVGRTATSVRRAAPIVLSVALVVFAVGGLKGWFAPLNGATTPGEASEKADSADSPAAAMARMRANLHALNIPGVKAVQVEWPADGVVDPNRVSCILVQNPTPEKLDALRSGRDPLTVPSSVLSQLHDHKETMRLAEGQPELMVESLCFAD